MLGRSQSTMLHPPSPWERDRESGLVHDFKCKRVNLDNLLRNKHFQPDFIKNKSLYICVLR